MLKRTLCIAIIALVSLALGQDVKVEKYQLPNGMTIILHEDHSLPVVSVNLWYHVGSKDEQPRRSGFAHLFEHLMFMGTERVPTGQFDAIMEGSGGSNNASTAEDRTNFYDTGPSAMLPTLLWLEADRLEGLGKAMDQKKLDLQREVVKNERRESYDNAPYGPAHLAIYGIMFPEGHPYHIPVIGTHEDLNAATVQDVKDFFATYYVPNNVSMVIAGDFSSKVIKPTIGDLFGTLPRQNEPIHRIAPTVQFEGIHRLTMVDKVQNPKLIMVWHSPAAYTDGDIDIQLAGSILSDGVASRLYQKLVIEKELATDVSASQDSLMLGSLFSIEVTPQPGGSLDRIEKEVDGVLATFAKDGPKSDELKRQAAKIEYSTLSGLSSIGEVADKLNEYEYFLGEPNAFKKVLDGYRNAKTRDVRDAARATFRPDARLIMRVLPEEPSAPSDARNKRPSDVSEMAFTLPKATTFKLTNGMTVNYWYRPELPLMEISAVFKDPAALDPRGKAGRMHLTATLMDEGAGSLDSTALDNALSQLGADISENAVRGGLIIGLSTLSSNLDKALDYYAMAIEKPRFDPEDWSRMKNQHLADLKDILSRPNAVAQHVSSFRLFAGDGPYSIPMEGTDESVHALKLDDIKDAYAHVVRPENVMVFASGSVDEASMHSSLEKRFGSWKASETGHVQPEAITEPSTDGLKVFVVDKPAAPQTVIRFALPAANVNDPQRVELEALSTILGGTFTSRLNHNLREDKGYTYGASSTFYMDPRIGLFVASADVRADVTGASLKEFMAELGKIRNADVSPDEAQKARLSMRSDLVQSMAGAGGIVGTAVSLWMDDKPFESLNEELAKIAKLQAADINAVANSGIRIDHGVLVLVGDKTLILKQLEGLGLPKAEVVEAR